MPEDFLPFFREDTTVSMISSPAAGDSQACRDSHRDFLFPCLLPLYSEPLVLSSAQGVWVKDLDGKEYLDFFAGILTTSLGHRHPAVLEATRRQMEQLGHISSLYIHPNQVEVARKLAEISPGGLKSCYFTNSGTEAVETAIMLAQMYTGRQEIIVLRLSFSGRSTVACNMTGNVYWRPLPSSAANIKHAMSPFPYRSPFSGSEEELAERFANDIEEVIQTTTNGKPAAFFAETIQGVGGYIVPPRGYFQRAARIIRNYGGLFISDEVQTGFGRTGEKWFGIEHWDVEPDIMVMAKGIANGAPVGATITRPEIAQAWTAKTISTYGGNPVSMAAARATLEVMQQENTPRRSTERGKQLRQGLNALADRFECIGEVRGMGLMQAIELVEDRQRKQPSSAKAMELIEACKKEGLLLGLGGLNGNVIRIGPSMLISPDEVSQGLERLERAFAQCF